MGIKVNLDHLVIAAADLTSGVEYVKRVLGVEMPYGGEHEKMGTHNHLMSLGAECFLEIIAINPTAKRPQRLRWYGLDDPFVRQAIAQCPRLIGWVVNSSDIKATLEQVDFQFGKVESISRGNLDWYFSLPEDGRLLASGLVPYVMQWNTATHPAGSMASVGCRLSSLELYHSNVDWLEAVLSQLTVLEFVSVNSLDENDSPYMTAVIETPTGPKQLSSKG